MSDQKTVAIVGASADRKKFSNKSVRAHARQGWAVYPINPNGGEVEGLTAYTSLTAVPAKVHRVSLYLPPAIGVKILPEIAAAKPDEFFVNPGAESDELIEAARQVGLEPILACSIVDVGVSPADFPD